MFPGFERSNRLPGMQVVAGEDRNRIDPIVAQDLCFITGGVTELVAAGGMLRAAPRGGGNPDKLNPGNLLDGWQHDCLGEITGTQYPEPDKSCSRLPWRGHSVSFTNWQNTGFDRQHRSFLVIRVCQDDPEIRATALLCDQPVRLFRLFDREPVGD